MVVARPLPTLKAWPLASIFFERSSWHHHIVHMHEVARLAAIFGQLRRSTADAEQEVRVTRIVVVKQLPLALINRVAQRHRRDAVQPPCPRAVFSCASFETAYSL